MDTLQAKQSLVVIPLKPPYTQILVPIDNADLSSIINIFFPKECAWCGSKNVIGDRPVQFQATNPGYTSQTNRKAMDTAALAIGATVGGVGGGLLYELVKSSEYSKVTGFSFWIKAPHCADHLDSPAADVFQFVGIGQDVSTITVQVRNAEYAQSIVDYSNIYIQKQLFYTSLDTLIWPDMCFICGKPHATEKIPVDIHNPSLSELTKESEKQNIPICKDDLKKVKKADRLTNSASIIVALIVLAIGIPTLWIEMSLLAHSLVCLCGMPLLLGGLFGLAQWISRRIVRLNDVEATARTGTGAFSPLSISFDKKDNLYKLEFKRSDIAEEMYRLNKGLYRQTS